MSAFINACKDNDIEKVKSLIKLGHNIEETDENGWSGFVWAWMKDDIEIIKLLIRNDVDIEIVPKNILNGKTGFTFACLCNNVRMIKLLMENNANMEARSCYGTTGFVLACMNNRNEAVKILLENDVDVYAENNHGENIFDNYLYFKDNYEIMSMLINYINNHDNMIKICKHKFRPELCEDFLNILIGKNVLDDTLMYLLNLYGSQKFKFNDNNVDKDLLFKYLVDLRFYEHFGKLYIPKNLNTSQLDYIYFANNMFLYLELNNLNNNARKTLFSYSIS